MSVLKPRNRLVNFRVTEEEFEKLRGACVSDGARSLSDFARGSVLRRVEVGAAADRGAANRLPDLDQKVSELEFRVEELIRLVAATSRSVGESALAAHPASLK